MNIKVPGFEDCDEFTSYDPRRFPLTDLLPQAGGMRLIDRLVAVSNKRAVTALTVRDDPLFALVPGQVPGWVGLEYMAQSIAAWSGYHCLYRGEAIRAGLLLGTRTYDAVADHFLCGEKLTVQVERVFEAANAMCVFDCKIHGASCLLARARLNVLLPRDLQAYLQGGSHEP